jgi:hypothetical protein
LTTSDDGNAIVGFMTPPSRNGRDARAVLATDVTVMASVATAAAEIVQWPLIVAADRVIHLLERLRRHPDGC